jgi:hypothetical protein
MCSHQSYNQSYRVYPAPYQSEQFAHPYNTSSHRCARKCLRGELGTTVSRAPRTFPVTVVDTPNSICNDDIGQNKKDALSKLLDELATIHQDMKEMVTKVNTTIENPQYSFDEDEFIVTIRKWKALKDKRAELLEKLTSQNDIHNTDGYIDALQNISKLNQERQTIVDEIYSIVNAPYVANEKTLQDQIDDLTFKNERLESTIKDMSSHATTYTQAKEREVSKLHAKLEEVTHDFDNYKYKYAATQDHRIQELKQHIEELIHNS